MEFGGPMGSWVDYTKYFHNLAAIVPDGQGKYVSEEIMTYQIYRIQSRTVFR
jgi:hypothetical protein